MSIGPNPQDPNSPLYEFIDTQPPDFFPVDPPAGDSSLSHFTTRQMTPTAITAAWPPVVTLNGHGLQNGQSVRATKFYLYPMAVATGMYQLNNNIYNVQNVTTNTFELWNYPNNTPVDGRNFTSYVAGGQLTLVGQDVLIVNPSPFPPPGNVVPSE